MSTTATANPSFVPQSPSHWVPDEKRASCKSCHTAFTFFNRRHHCRSCREVFCGDCSDFRLLTRDPKDPSVVVSVRACHPCFDKFRGRKIRGQKKANSGLAAAAPAIAKRRNSKAEDPHTAETTQALQQSGIEMPPQHWEGEDAEITGAETIREEEDEDHHDYPTDGQQSTLSDTIIHLPIDRSAVDRDQVMAAQGSVVLPSKSVHGGLQFVPVDTSATRNVSAQDKANLGAVEGSEEILHIPSDALASVRHSDISNADSDAREAGGVAGVTRQMQQLHTEPLPETRVPSIVPVKNTTNIQGGMHTPVIASAPLATGPLVVGKTREVGASDSIVEVDDASQVTRGERVAVETLPRHATPAAQTFTSPNASQVVYSNTAAVSGQRIDIASQYATVGPMVTSPLPETRLGESVVLVSDINRLEGGTRIPLNVSAQDKANLGAVAGSEEILNIPSDALASVKHSNMSSLNKDTAGIDSTLTEKDEFGRSVSAVEGSEEFLNIPSDALASVKHSDMAARQQQSSKEAGEVEWSERNVENRYVDASPTNAVPMLFEMAGEQQQSSSQQTSNTRANHVV